jgi:protein CWC15
MFCSDEDDDDDELELQRELERIKAERAAAHERKEAEERLAEEAAQREGALKGNPLLNLDGSGSEKVKRRWNDDVVFRHQTRSEPETKKRFINDTIRSDFHRSFLKKYVH